MYNNVYEDYIRSMIGKSDSRNDYLNCGNTIYDNMYGNDIYGNYDFDNNFMSSQMVNNGFPMNTTSDVDLEECYPELYRLLYPMVQKVCMKCTRSLSRNVIDEMVEEVYTNFVGDEGEVTQININLSNEVRSSKDLTGSAVHSSSTMNRSNISNSNINKSTLSKSNVATTKSSTEPRLDRSVDRNGEDRQVGQKNPVLNDLIRILILRELLGKPGGNSRPPFGRPPQRPPHNNRPNYMPNDRPNNRPNNNVPNFPNSPNFPNYPSRPNPVRPRENRLSFNSAQQSIYNAYPSEMFEDGYNIF